MTPRNLLVGASAKKGAQFMAEGSNLASLLTARATVACAAAVAAAAVAARACEAPTEPKNREDGQVSSEQKAQHWDPRRHRIGVRTDRPYAAYIIMICLATDTLTHRPAGGRANM